MGRTRPDVGEPRPLNIALEERGLGVVFKPYCAEMMRELWRRQTKRKGANSREMHEHILGDYPDKRRNVSRASVIIELNNFVGWGILSYTEKTGKGGHHRVYRAKMTEEEFWVWLAGRTCEALREASNMPDLFELLPL